MMIDAQYRRDEGYRTAVLTALLDDYQDGIVHYCVARLGEVIGEEVAQEVFVTAWERLPTFRQDSKENTMMVYGTRRCMMVSGLDGCPEHSLTSGGMTMQHGIWTRKVNAVSSAQRWSGWGVTLGVLLFVMGAVGTVRADCSGTQPYVVCEQVKVTELYIHVDSYAAIKVDANMDALPCTLHGGYILLRSDEANFRPVYATLLAAQLQNRDVFIRIHPDDPVCSVVYVILK